MLSKVYFRSTDVQMYVQEFVLFQQALWWNGRNEYVIS